MKKLSLQGDIYSKFYEISDKIWENIDSDISLLNLATNFKKLMALIDANSGGGDEAYGRSMHYVVLDNINTISDYLDNSDEVAFLKNTFIGMFEILEISDSKVIFLNITTGKIFKIIGEGEGSESSLERDFSKGDLIISRLINLDDGWYNMKTFYYITNKDLEQGFEELKIVYKNVFNGVKDMLDMEERMNMLIKNTEKMNSNERINYFKRIKALLFKSLGKKQYKKLENILKIINQETYTNCINFLADFKINNNSLNEFKEYVSAYIQENIKTPEQEKQNKLNARLTVVMESFFEVLRNEKMEISRKRKMTELESKQLEERKTKWLNEINSLFGNKTPLAFIHEIDPDYDVNNLRFQQIQEGEIEFYDGYKKYFTDEEKEIYEEALKNSTSGKYIEAREGYSKLLKEHNDFFRLKGNYLSVSVNCIIDKYGKVKDDSFIDDVELDELENDWNLLLNIDEELINLDKLKKGYSIKGSNNFEYIKKHFQPLLGHLVRKKREQLLNILIANKNEKELLEKLKEIIPDFEIFEFIEEVKKVNSLFLDIYDDRIVEGLGYKEDDMYEIFPYFWNKYKNKDDFIDDDIEKLYKKIGIRKLKIDGLTKFNSFILKNSKQIKSKYSNIIENFNDLVGMGEITKPFNILLMIEDKKLKDDFLLSMNILGIKIK